MNEAIKDFVLFANQELPWRRVQGITEAAVTPPLPPPVHIPRLPPERLDPLNDHAQLEALYCAENLSRNAIAGRLGVSRSAVGEALKRIGLAKKEKPKSRHPGQIPFGWDWKDEKLVKNQKEQETIRWIQQMQRSGKSLRGIAKVLNEANVPTKNEGVWQANTVRQILLAGTRKGNISDP